MTASDPPRRKGEPRDPDSDPQCTGEAPERSSRADRSRLRLQLLAIQAQLAHIAYAIVAAAQDTPPTTDHRFRETDIETAARQALIGWPLTDADVIACDCCGRSLWPGDTITVALQRSEAALSWELIDRSCPACDGPADPDADAVHAIGTATLGERRVEQATIQLVLEDVRVTEIRGHWSDPA